MATKITLILRFEFPSQTAPRSHARFRTETQGVKPYRQKFVEDIKLLANKVTVEVLSPIVAWNTDVLSASLPPGYRRWSPLGLELPAGE
jgi:hypothetical protein